MLPPILLFSFVVNISHVRSYIISLVCLQWSEFLIFLILIFPFQYFKAP